MGLYKTADLLKFLTDMYASHAYLTEFDTGHEDSLWLRGLVSNELSFETFVDPVEDDIELSINSDQPCYGLIFSWEDLDCLRLHLANVLEYYDAYISSEDSPEEMRDKIRDLQSEARDLLSRLSRFFDAHPLAGA